MVFLERIGFCDIYLYKKSYIVHNSYKEYSNGHAHTNSINQARRLAYLCSYNKIVPNLSNYTIESLSRLSNNKKYIRALKRSQKIHSL